MNVRVARGHSQPTTFGILEARATPLCNIIFETRWRLLLTLTRIPGLVGKSTAIAGHLTSIVWQAIHIQTLRMTYKFVTSQGTWTLGATSTWDLRTAAFTAISGITISLEEIHLTGIELTTLSIATLAAMSIWHFWASGLTAIGCIAI